MTRYIAIPRAFVSATHTPEHQPTCTVWEQEAAPVNTRLLDQTGTPLYRMPDRMPIGFVSKPRKGT